MYRMQAPTRRLHRPSHVENVDRSGGMGNNAGSKAPSYLLLQGIQTFL
jgi:hypothetical protein